MEPVWNPFLDPDFPVWEEEEMLILVIRMLQQETEMSLLILEIRMDEVLF